MNNLLSYCGLVDSKIRAPDKDLPVPLSVLSSMKVFLGAGKLSENLFVGVFSVSSESIGLLVLISSPERFYFLILSREILTTDQNAADC